jgi:micrococcal nuclease
MARPRRCLSLMLIAALPFCIGAESYGDTSHVVPGPISAELLRVIDGDTIEVRARIWLDLDLTTRVRLAGIDAPELNGGCAEERRLAGMAKLALTETLGSGPVWLADIRRDKYGGRVVAEVMLSDGRNASATMLSSGAAAAWGSTPAWCAR